jgi:hypothetical protein
MEFVTSQFCHCKTIRALGASSKLLEKSGYERDAKVRRGVADDEDR